MREGEGEAIWSRRLGCEASVGWSGRALQACREGRGAGRAASPCVCLPMRAAAVCAAPQMPERKYKQTLRGHRSQRIEMARKVRAAAGACGTVTPHAACRLLSQASRHTTRWQPGPARAPAPPQAPPHQPRLRPGRPSPPPPPPAPQEIAHKGEVALQKAKEAAAHRKEFLVERANNARDARALRNRGERPAPPALFCPCCAAPGPWARRSQAGPGCAAALRLLLAARQGTVAHPCRAPPSPPTLAPTPWPGVLRVHERLARERNKLKDDDRAMRLEALKVRA